MKTHLFEGAQHTMVEICAMVPRLNRTTVRRFLAQGMTTRKEMLEVTPQWSALARKRKSKFNRYDPERDSERAKPAAKGAD